MDAALIKREGEKAWGLGDFSELFFLSLQLAETPFIVLHPFRLSTSERRDTMPKTDLVIRIGGDTATDPGIISAGEIVTHAAALAGLDIYTFKTFPAEIKGGQALYQVRINNQILLSQGDAVDVLVVFNQKAYELNSPEMVDGHIGPGGILIYDSNSVEPEPKHNRIDYGVPFTKIAEKQVGSALSKNMVALGILAAALGIPNDELAGAVKRQFALKKREIVNMNLKALAVGSDYFKQHATKQDSYVFPYSEHPPKLVLDGNEAIALGAIAAGVKVFAGYPITPASSIMHLMQRELPKFGGVAIQAENELAAMGILLGASFAGKKAMTATSGPGLSLMVEQINLGAMAEIPAVIMDIQRGGASTGLPTKTAQGDLNIALYGVHNESPRIVMALTSVEDSFYGTIRAFNLAETYQTPVIVLSDQYLGLRKATVNKPDLSKIEIEDRVKPEKGKLADYRRYQITGSGISPMSVPGMKGFCYLASGLEHNEASAPSYTPKTHIEMTEKRFGKLSTLAKTLADSEEFVREYGDADAEIGILSWGSIEGIVREAVFRLQNEHTKIAALHPKLLNPLPIKRIQEFSMGKKQLIIPEVNYTGQFASLLRDKCGLWFDERKIELIQLNKDEGMPFTPVEICNKLEEALKQGSKGVRGRGRCHFLPS